jgi:hypothetical protein
LEEISNDIIWWINYYSSSQDWVQFFDKQDFNWYNWYGIKYFLYEYEESLAGSDAVRVSWNEVDSLDKEKSIEHILPQTPEGVEYWESRFTPEERKLLTHNIGNLSLTKDNSSYGTKPFPEKCGKADSEHPCYLTSNLAIERDICKYAEWTPKAIRMRQNKIAKWASDRWYVEPRDTTNQEEPISEESEDEEM